MKLKRVGIIVVGASLCLGTRDLAAAGASGNGSPPPVPPRGIYRQGNGTNGRHTPTTGNHEATRPVENVNANGNTPESNDTATILTATGGSTTARSVTGSPFETPEGAAEEGRGGDTSVDEGLCGTSTPSAPEPPVERVPLVLKIEQVDSDQVVETTLGNVKCFKVVEEVNIFSSVEIGCAKKAINCVGPESVVCYVADDKKHYIMIANKIQNSWRRCNLSVERGKTFIRRDFASGTKFPVDIDFETIFDRKEEESIEETQLEQLNADENETTPLEEVGEELDTVQSEGEHNEPHVPVEVQQTLREPSTAVQLPLAPATAPSATTKSLGQTGRLQAVQIDQGKNVAKSASASAAAKDQTVDLADGRMEAPSNSTLVNTQAIAETEPEIIYTYKHNEEPFLYHYRVKRLPNRQLYHKVGYGNQVPDLLKTLSHLNKPYDSEVPILFWDSIHASTLLAGYSLQVYEDFSVLDLVAGNEDVLFVMANMELWLSKQVSHHLVLYNGATRSWMSLESKKMGTSKRFLITPDPHYPGGCTATSLQ